MYTRCIACQSFLGRNEVLEPFPVGRRLAFDPANGRLWVLCRSCRQWNLAPLHERWEAVEAAERLFEGASIGSSTQNVAVGRVSEGTELVRVGRVSRPEIASWRYGHRLLGRWRRHRRTLKVGIGAGAVLGAIPVLGEIAYAGLGAWIGVILLRDLQPVMRTPGGGTVRRGDAERALLLPGRVEPAWSLVVPRLRTDDITLEGDDALLALRRLLPRANLKGGHPDEVRNATEEAARLRDPRLVLHAAALELQDPANMDDRELPWRKRPHRIATGHPVIKLALEMAVNEETERRAMEGELALLEREWRDAAELAAIADDLLFPSALRDRLDQLKARYQPD